jgi:hypothetical protein
VTLTSETFQPSKKSRQTLTQVPHRQLAGFIVPHHGIELITFLLVNTKIASSLVMHLHIRKPSAPGSAPTGWTLLDLNYGGRNCLLLRFLAQNPTKELQAPQHNHVLRAQLINQNLNGRLNVPIILNGYSPIKCNEMSQDVKWLMRL